MSGIVVVDADEPEALRWLVRRLPWTPWQTQTARGFHLWYRHPGVRVPNRARVETGAGKLKIDVRGDGGYVIAPGSVHASGAAYLQAGDWSEPRARVPVFWPGWLARPKRPAAKPTRSLTDSEPLSRARAYLAAIPKPEIGYGSDADTLYAACRLVRGFALSPVDAEDLLWEWAAVDGLDASMGGQKVARAGAMARKTGPLVSAPDAWISRPIRVDLRP